MGREAEVVGLLPAAGHASRIAPLPCSKELFPIGFGSANGRTRPKVAAQYLLERMRLAGVTRAYIVLRHGKWDIPAYFNDGAALDMHLAYLMMGAPFGPPYTLDQAYPFVKDALVAFGFPDIVFSAEDVFERLLDRQAAAGADVVLGLFPAREPRDADMVHVDRAGAIRAISIKPARSRLRHTWLVAVWTPVFSAFMHHHLKAGSLAAPREEVSVGHVFKAAISAGMRFDSVIFDDRSWTDIGRPGDLVNAVRRHSNVPSRIAK